MAVEQPTATGCSFLLKHDITRVCSVNAKILISQLQKFYPVKLLIFRRRKNKQISFLFNLLTDPFGALNTNHSSLT